jgi:hypothetical protein
MNPLGGDEDLTDVGGAVTGGAEGDLEPELEVGVVELPAIDGARAVEHRGSFRIGGER